MKQLFTLLFSVISLTAFATIRTVSNNPSTIAQFNTIQTAVNASADGDTVYVHGSPNPYAAFTLTDKRLTIIGPGWAPDKNISMQTIIEGCTFNNTPAPGSPSGSELQGLIFTSAVSLSLTNGVDDLRLIRCQFNQVVFFTISCTGMLVEGCIFLSTVHFSGAQTYTNFLFQNNIFFAPGNVTSFSIFDIRNAVNVRFDHNLFYSDRPSPGVPVFGNICRFLLLTNNIFNQRNPASNLSLSTFTNNITFNCGSFGDTAWIRNDNVDGGGNVAAQNPQMTNQAAVNAGTINGLLDFTIAAGPANNSGSDGKDMGLLYDPTGSLNWANSRNSRLPRINKMNLVNPTIATGGTLTVTVEAKTSN